jgi:hypothetical protein|eukprot:COSAG01_NODE_338_length_18671_cov_259.238154_13_plen_82_part_00
MTLKQEEMVEALDMAQEALDFGSLDGEGGADGLAAAGEPDVETLRRQHGVLRRQTQRCEIKIGNLKAEKEVSAQAEPCATY